METILASNSALTIRPTSHVEQEQPRSPTYGFKIESKTLIFDPCTAGTPPSEFMNNLKRRMSVYFDERPTSGNAAYHKCN